MNSASEILDPFDALHDPQMPFLRQALDPMLAGPRLAEACSSYFGGSRPIELQAARVTRYKPARRCLIEYDLRLNRPDGRSETITLIGKARAKGADKRTFQLLKLLRSRGFGSQSPDGISVPEPIGLVAEWNLWLQRKVSGLPASELLLQDHWQTLVGRIAAAAHKLHQAAVDPDRKHTIADELEILRDRLALTAQLHPSWTERLRRLLQNCERLASASALSKAHTCGIHRDFYPAQALVEGPRIWLLDFDLYCQGDPALDIGNFVGHLTEQSLRSFGDASALADREKALEDRFVELSGEVFRSRLRIYALLTLVRHIHISTQFEDRRPFTEPLLNLCEERFGRLAQL